MLRKGKVILQKFLTKKGALITYDIIEYNTSHFLNSTNFRSTIAANILLS